jgi:hypothetical protein
MYHHDLAEGKWRELTLMEQMGNIGSEVGRAVRWRGRNEIHFQKAVDRALELFDLTLADPRWRGRTREIARAREVFCDAAFLGGEYYTTLQDMERYFFPFAVAARRLSEH